MSRPVGLRALDEDIQRTRDQLKMWMRKDPNQTRRSAIQHLRSRLVELKDIRDRIERRITDNP